MSLNFDSPFLGMRMPPVTSQFLYLLCYKPGEPNKAVQTLEGKKKKSLSALDESCVGPLGIYTLEFMICHWILLIYILFYNSQWALEAPGSHPNQSENKE